MAYIISVKNPITTTKNVDTEHLTRAIERVANEEASASTIRSEFLDNTTTRLTFAHAYNQGILVTCGRWLFYTESQGRWYAKLIGHKKLISNEPCNMRQAAARLSIQQFEDLGAKVAVPSPDLRVTRRAVRSPSPPPQKLVPKVVERPPSPRPVSPPRTFAPTSPKLDHIVWPMVIGVVVVILASFAYSVTGDKSQALMVQEIRMARMQTEDRHARSEAAAEARHRQDEARQTAERTRAEERANAERIRAEERAEQLRVEKRKIKFEEMEFKARMAREDREFQLRR